MTQPFVICLGEAMVELSLSADDPETARIGFAGDTLNTAIYLKRALPEARIAYATKVGTDDFSDQMVAMMEEEGLDTSLVFRSETRTCGLYAIKTDAAGERSFSYWRSASAAREVLAAPGLTPAHIARADMLYYSAISLAILPPEHRPRLFDWLSAYRADGGRTCFDSNYRPALWPDRQTAQDMISRAWRCTDLGLPSVDDEQAIYGDADEAAVLARLNGFGVTQGALKRGAKGPRALSGAPAGSFPPAEKVVDSTAAGDSFNAAYLASYLSGKPEEDSLRAGHMLASRVIGARGAILPR